MDILLRTLLEEFTHKMKTFIGGIIRQVSFSDVSDKVKVAIGMRRTGKTYLMFQTIQKVLENTPITRILYINFEDDRLIPMTQQKLGQLIDSFYTLYPENHDQVCYLFFDEIQNVEDWQVVIRRYLDTKMVKIYLTGSSAKLLSKEIATSLRGRSIATEVWPFSFDEFLMAKNKSHLNNQSLGRRSLDNLKEYLSLYLNQGGFPEITFLNRPDSVRILQDYVSVVILRDIIERHKITNISLVQYIINTLLKNVGCNFSGNKFFNDLKSQGFSVSKTTIYDYLEYIEDTYLAFTIPIYAESLRKVQTNPKKIYAIDNGLIKAYTMSFSQNLGRHFENLIYLDLRRYGHEVYYYLTATRKEVDFFARNLYGQWSLYQVCWNIDDAKTMEREMAALNEAEKELNIKGEIITPDTYFSSFLPTMRSKLTLDTHTNK